jgi:hypothetical protein
MIQNIQIFDCPVGKPSSGTFYGPWTSIGNLAGYSISFTGLEGSVFVETSNDPNVNFNGVAAIAAPLAPTCRTFQYGALKNQGSPSVSISYVVQGGGETVASGATSIAVADGFQLMVSPPALDTLGIAVGYNVYVGIGGLSYLQNMPNSSDRFGSSHNGPLPLNMPYIMYDGFQSTGVVPSIIALVGGPAIGEQLWNNSVTTSTGELQVNIGGTSPPMATISPSGLTYGMIRIGKSGANTLETKAWVSGRYAY